VTAAIGQGARASRGDARPLDGSEENEKMRQATTAGARSARRIRTRRPSTAGLIVAAALALAALSASPALAAGQLEFNATTAAPASLAPGGSGDMILSLTNVGDAPITLVGTTVTATMPAGIVATSISAPQGAFFSPPWTCSLGVGGATASCSGNANFTLPAGATQCNFAGFQNGACNITVRVQASPTIPLGQQTIAAEACVTGAPPCATASLETSIQHFGDDFGFAPINGPGTATVPALPEQTLAFWAGACDIAAAPAPGSPIPAPGIGTQPALLNVPSSGGTTTVPAPVTPTHCIDWGVPTPYQTQPGVWTEAPAWRQPAADQAGAHPDGTTTLALRKQPDGRSVDGAVDNIIVDLPPGFTGNPNAAAKCTPEQFVTKPPTCPPESQVGLLNLYLEGFFGALNHGNGNSTLYPVWNLEPRQGKVAEFGFAYASGERATTVRLVAKVRSSTDNGITGFVGQIPAALPLIMQSITLWGVPWAPENDLWRAPQGLAPSNEGCSRPPGMPLVVHYVSPIGFAPECQQAYDPSWGDTPAERTIRPLLSNETDCNPEPTVTGRMDQYLEPGSFTPDGEPDADDPNWKTATAASPPVVDCEELGFAPDIEFEPTTSAADGASGLKVDLSIPQNNDPRDGTGDPLDPPAPGASQGEIDDYVADATAYWRSPEGRATAHLKDTQVTLPPGVSVNPSGARGLEGCPDATVGVRQAGNPPLFDNVDPFDGVGSPASGDECPDGSKIGTVVVETPVLDEPLTGDVILGEPQAGDIKGPNEQLRLRMYLVVREPSRGLLVKIFGSAVTDPQTGQLTATFENNPELPFDHLSVEFKGGPHGLIAMPPRCGAPEWSTAFTPWSSVGAATPVADTLDGGAFAVNANCGYPFGPGLAAGNSTKQAGAMGGTFSFEFTRPEGHQTINGLTAELPTGLLASVKDVPLCTNAQAAANACPAASRIGTVDAAAGSGDPFVLEQKGSAYLTEGYKGAPYGLAVSIPVEAGPFKGDKALTPIVVRQALHVDRTTAQVTAVSDPLPTIHHGIPLRARRATVIVDRPGFMRNPTDCSAKQIRAALGSTEGALAAPTAPFQVSGCAGLGFKPKLGLRLTGRKQARTGKHPGIRAVVTQRLGEAGVGKAVVRLPKSLALDPNNAQALCEFADGTKPDLENHCPKASIVGRARAITPLLRQPLVGDVYFVKNVRIDPTTGNQIRTLPMIVVALRGEIAVNLRGVSDTTKGGKLVNTFEAVPDAPISQFNLNIKGGGNGIIAVTGTRRGNINLCTKPRGHVAEADWDGQNGKRHDRNIRMKTPCTKRATKLAKRRAAAQRRAAAARRAAARKG
jgi:hypothetical protein